MPEAWSGDDRASFGPEAQRWYVRCLWHFIDTHPRIAQAKLQPDAVETLRAWYARQVDESDVLEHGACRPRYLQWVPAIRFDDSDSAHGDWEFNDSLVAADLEAGMRESRKEACRAVDLSRVRSLDDWLRREREGDFIVDGCTGGKLPHEIVLKLMTRASSRRHTWPRPCAECEREYRPDAKRGNGKRCVGCLDDRREAPRARHRKPTAGRPGSARGE